MTMIITLVIIVMIVIVTHSDHTIIIMNIITFDTNTNSTMPRP